MKHWTEQYSKGEVVYRGDDGLLLCGDSLKLLRGFRAGSQGLIVTDVPYGISESSQKRCTFVNGVPATVNYADWDCFESEGKYARFIRKALGEMHRVCSAGASMYIWADRKALGREITPFMEDVLGWGMKSKVYGEKKNPAPRWRKVNWTNCVQECGYFTNGKAKVFNFGEQKAMRNVLYYPVGRRPAIHPTQKAKELIEPLIRVSSGPGDIVLDPFAGSCVVAEEAQKLGRRFICIDINRKYLEEALSAGRIRKS